jgi:acid stress-induced BolA-like protein IbaG/YrbA
MQEPKRDNTLDNLVGYVAARAQRVITRMQARGFDPIVFEGKRSVQRQRWLYGQGRSKLQCIRAGISPAYSHSGGIVTKTLDSKHITGKAVDIISKSRLWNHSVFFAALKQEAARENLHVLNFEQCHLEWRG